MVGIGGSVGNPPKDIGHLEKWITYGEDEVVNQWTDEHVSILTSTPTVFEDEFPVRCDHGYLWLWGQVWSHREDGTYVPKSTYSDSVRFGHYVATLFDRFGLDAVNRLNGQFTGILFQPENNQLHIFNDRLGSRPLFILEAEDTLIFSSNIHAICELSNVRLTPHRDSLYAFLTFGRTLGTSTPFREVSKLPPATIYSYNIANQAIESTRYWVPRYEPRGWSLSEIVDELDDCIDEISNEIDRYELDLGLLLSGGSDSRLLTDCFSSLSCYHLNEYDNREAQVARDVAEATNHEFECLYREFDHYSKVLNRGGEINSFFSWFEQGHLLGYDGLDLPDLMLSGQYADTLLSAYHYPKMAPSIPPFNKFKSIPIGRRIDTVEQYIDSWADGSYGRLPALPGYIECENDIETVLHRHIFQVNDSIHNHSIEYPSLSDTLHSHGFYPLTNSYTYFMYHSVLQTVPTYLPYLDYRILDFSLKIPLRYRLRKRIVDRVIDRRNADLASIRDPKSGLAIHHNSYAHQLYRVLGFDTESSTDRHPPYLDHASPWVNHAELLRYHPFVIQSLDSNRELMEEFPFINTAKVLELSREHLRGSNHWGELYGLATLLKMPTIDDYLE